MLDLIASILVRGFNKIFHVIPIYVTLWISRRIGVLAYFLSGKRNKVAYSNLKAAFCEEKDPRELKRLTKSVYRNMGQTFAEMVAMTKMDSAYMEKYLICHGLDKLEAAATSSDGMLLVSAHFDNWELSTAYSAMIGYPLHMFIREQKMEKLNELLNEMREIKGSILIRKGMDIKNLFRILHSGGSVGLLGDQNAGVNGELLDVFGRPASMAVGPYRIARKTGAKLLPCFIHRVKGPYHEVFVEDPICIGKDEDIKPYMARYNRLLEKHVRRDPDQWLWMHKRWKVTPLKKVLVLDDGKKGHLKQSLAVVEQIKRYRESEGNDPENIKVEIAEVRFKNTAAKGLFNLMSIFLTPCYQIHLRLLESVLEKDSYKSLIRRYADIVISCGSGLFGVNQAMKIESNARNLTVLDPGLFGRNKFDVIVMPRHDLKENKERDNFVITDLAPNLIDKDEIDAAQKTLDGSWRSEERGGRCIGLLFGGDNKYFTFQDGQTRSIASGVKKAAADIDGYLCATTSRRTSRGVENILEEELVRDPNCLKFISGKDDKDKKTVEKILARSSVIIVSGESISMISEAVSSRKSVLVFMPDKNIPGKTKYERFAEGLEKKGYLKIVDPENIQKEVKKIFKSRQGRGCLEDNIRIREKMYKLF